MPLGVELVEDSGEFGLRFVILFSGDAFFERVFDAQEACIEVVCYMSGHGISQGVSLLGFKPFHQAVEEAAASALRVHDGAPGISVGQFAEDSGPAFGVIESIEEPLYGEGTDTDPEVVTGAVLDRVCFVEHKCSTLWEYAGIGFGRVGSHCEVAEEEGVVCDDEVCMLQGAPGLHKEASSEEPALGVEAISSFTADGFPQFGGGLWVEFTSGAGFGYAAPSAEGGNV